MKKILLIILLAVILVSCTDDITKSNKNKPRIEFTDCTGCLECIESFNCPENAIKIDTLRGKTFIDADDCVSCYECIDEFDCPEEAISNIADVTSPGKVRDLTISSFEDNSLKIWFRTSGDDIYEGNCHNYRMNIFYDDTIVNTQTYINECSGTLVSWEVDEIEADSIQINIVALDEASNVSDVAISTAIAGEINDNIPPNTIDDLEAISLEGKINLSWTSPEDIREPIPVVAYELRYSTEEISKENWEDATSYEIDFTPANPGSLENLEIQDLTPNVNYYFAIKSLDAFENISELSNCVSAKILIDETSPNAIDDLVELSVSPNSLTCSWTSVGDDGDSGTAESYQIKISTTEITEENWSSLDEFEQNIIPQEAGNQETIYFDNLESLTNYFVGIKVIDESDNISDLSNILSIQTTETPDDVPPATVNDLEANSTDDSIEISWTAVGDDDFEGIANYYELRYSQENITSENWNSANSISNEPTPQEAGEIENYSFVDYEVDVTYYFALKVFDDAGNSSDISNVDSAIIESEEDLIPPSAISDLEVLQGNTYSDDEMKINFTATGDDEDSGTATSYEIRYFSEEITNANWNEATVFENDFSPQEAGTEETLVISGLEAGELLYFAIKAIDENQNTSALSNSSAGKIVYQINEAACHDCGACINDCPEGAIHDYSGYKSIDPDQCDACGSCSCPYGLISLYVISY